MNKSVKYFALGLVATVPIAIGASVSPSSAQVVGPYTPATPTPVPATPTPVPVVATPTPIAATPAPQLPQSETTANDVVLQFVKIKTKLIVGTKKKKKLTIKTGAPGTYSVKIYGRIPGKKYTLISRGSLDVPAGDTAESASLRLARTKAGAEYYSYLTKKGKLKKGKTVTVKIKITYTPLSGDPVVTEVKAKLKAA